MAGAVAPRAAGGVSARHPFPGGAGARQALQRDDRPGDGRSRPSSGAAGDRGRPGAGDSRPRPGLALFAGARHSGGARRVAALAATGDRRPSVERAIGDGGLDPRPGADGRSLRRRRERGRDTRSVLGQLPADLCRAHGRSDHDGAGLSRWRLQPDGDSRGAGGRAGGQARRRHSQSPLQPRRLHADA